MEIYRNGSRLAGRKRNHWTAIQPLGKPRRGMGMGCSGGGLGDLTWVSGALTHDATGHPLNLNPALVGR